MGADGDEERILELRADGARERAAEARALVEAGPAGAHMRARALLAGGGVEDRELAARILALIAEDGDPGADRAVRDLATLVAGEDEPAVLDAALAALGSVWDATPARDALLRLTDHSSFAVRWRLAEALHSAHSDGDEDVEDALGRLLADRRAIVRLEAAGAIGALPQSWTRTVQVALAGAVHDVDERVGIAALWAIARAGRPLPSEPVARLLAPERIDALRPSAAERLLEAVALSADTAAYAALEALRGRSAPPDPRVSRALTAALAWCAPPEWAPSHDDEPAFDRRRARWLMGKTVLVGLTHVSADGEPVGRRQLHGVVTRCDEVIVSLAIAGRDGEFTLPPDTRAFRYAPAGRYRMRETGEVVEDPDAECAWTVTAGGG